MIAFANPISSASAVNSWPIETSIKSFTAGTLKGGTTETYDAKRDGVGYATSGDFVKDISSKLEDYKKQIIDGKIVVPTKP